MWPPSYDVSSLFSVLFPGHLRDQSMLESLGEKDRRRLWLMSIVTAGLANRGLSALTTRFHIPMFELVANDHNSQSYATTMPSSRLLLSGHIAMVSRFLKSGSH